MVNKLVTKGAKFVARKVGSKILENTIDTLDYLNDRIGMGAQPLNVGEDETVRCYKAMPYDQSGFCENVGKRIRYNYNHPWKSKK